MNSIKTLVNCAFYIVLLVFADCKTKDKTGTTAVIVSDTPLNQSDENADVFRVVVSFISIGQGTDPEASAKLHAYLEKFGEENGLHASNIRIAWGREGELDNCFLLEDFTAAQQVKFVNGLKALFKGNELVQIQEYKPNKFKK